MTSLTARSSIMSLVDEAIAAGASQGRACAAIGMSEIDNFAAERALRGVAIGRRNYLLAGADTSGERAAAIYFLIGTAKLNGVDPEARLRHRRMKCFSVRRISNAKGNYSFPGQ